MAVGDRVPVVLYHYDASPMARKTRNILAVKRIPHFRVEMPQILPRPELADLLGVKYRRIPVLAIGRDVYCDSSLIAAALERHFPPSQGFGTIFPNKKDGSRGDTGLAKAFAMAYGDRTLGGLGSEMLPYQKFKPNFIKDRNQWFGKVIDAQAILANQPVIKSMLSSHLAMIEEQLEDGREWLMDTVTPGFTDLSIHYVFEWMLQFRALRHAHDLFDPAVFPAAVAWITRMSEYITKALTAHTAVLDNISGARAAELITSSVAVDPKNIGFDEVEASRLGVKLHEIVSVAPLDNGPVPTVGKLVALDKEEVVLETQGTLGKAVYCHLPKLYYSIKPSAPSAKL